MNGEIVTKKEYNTPKEKKVMLITEYKNYEYQLSVELVNNILFIQINQFE